MSAIALGLIFNFLVVLFFAFKSIAKNETSIGIAKLYNRKTMLEIKNKYPELSRNTTILVICLVLPFALFVITFIENLKKPNR